MSPHMSKKFLALRARQMSKRMSRHLCKGQDLTRVVVDKIDVSTAEKALNAKYNFFSLLEQLDVPTEKNFTAVV